MAVSCGDYFRWMGSKILRSKATQAVPGLDYPAPGFSTNTLAIIIGAGLAGCAITRALSNAGFKCLLYDRHPAPASETSAVPRALLRPQVTRTEQTTTTYFHQAFSRIHAELTTATPQKNNSAQLNGVLQLVRDCSLWPDSHDYRKLTRAEASHVASTELASDALNFSMGGSIDVADLCNHWITQCRVRNANSVEFVGNTAVQSLQQTADGWQLVGADNEVINESPLVIVASAEVASRLSETAHLPLQKSRGQISHFFVKDTDHLPKLIVTGKGSVIPANNGFWAGSTHQRQHHTSTPSTQDDQLNLRRAFAQCPQLERTTGYDKVASHSWVGFRYSTPDRLPIVGAAPDNDWYLQHYADLRHGRSRQTFPPAKFHNGLYLLTGFGSRGVLHSLHAAEILTGIISPDADCSDSDQQTVRQILHPGRFVIRQLRRGL